MLATRKPILIIVLVSGSQVLEITINVPIVEACHTCSNASVVLCFAGGHCNRIRAYGHSPSAEDLTQENLETLPEEREARNPGLPLARIQSLSWDNDSWVR